MATSYFDEVVNSLTSEDTNLLGVLAERDATAKFKAMKCAHVQVIASVTEANFRNITTRLSALKFVEINTDYKEHGISITGFGLSALASVLSAMDGEVVPV